MPVIKREGDYDLEVHEHEGNFLPSRLADELRAEGIQVEGVTCTEDENGNVIAVQVITPAKQDKKAIKKIVDKHTPVLDEE